MTPEQGTFLPIHAEFEASGAKDFAAVVAESYLNLAKRNLADLSSRLVAVRDLERFVSSREVSAEDLAGGVVLRPSIASKVIRGYSTAPSARDRPVWELTVRELEILETLHQGLRNSQLAERFSISPRTVEAHVGNIISKLGARGRTDAVRIAVAKNLVK